MASRILECTCKHDFQDRAYGANRRVMNKVDKEKNRKVFRCTVCSKEKVISE